MIQKIKTFIKRLKLCLKFLFNNGEGQWQILFSDNVDKVPGVAPAKIKRPSIISKKWKPYNPSNLILNARKRMIFRTEMNGWGTTPSLTYSFLNIENIYNGRNVEGMEFDYLESYVDVIKYPTDLIVLVYRERRPCTSFDSSDNPEFDIHLDVRNYSYEKLIYDMTDEIGWRLEKEGDTTKDDVYFYTASLRDDMSYFVSPLDKDKLWNDVSNRFNEDNVEEEKTCSSGYQGSGLGSKP